jgi:hypothetical protein
MDVDEAGDDQNEQGMLSVEYPCRPVATGTTNDNPNRFCRGHNKARNRPCAYKAKYQGYCGKHIAQPT